jgi:hypothetical protein
MQGFGPRAEEAEKEPPEQGGGSVAEERQAFVAETLVFGNVAEVDACGGAQVLNSPTSSWA